MFREGLGAKSRFVMMQLAAGSGATLRSRGGTGTVPAATDGPDEIAPQWLKLSRRGSLFTGWISGDGIAWSPIGSVNLALASQCSAGLATSAANAPDADPAATTTVVFSQISLSLPASEQPSVTLSSPVSGAAFTLEMPIIIEALAGDARGPIEKVELFNNGVKIGQADAPPFLLAWEGLAAGSYSVTALATGPGGSSTSSPPAEFSVNAGAGALPAPWQHTDLVPVPSPGSASASGDLFVVSSTAAATGTSSDSMHFVYQPWSGDGVIVARLLSIPNTSPQVFGGLMIRESLAPDARHAVVAVRAGFATHFGWRGRSGKASKSVAGPGVAAPRWLKLVRKGTRFSGFISADGVAWRRVWRQTIAMGESAYVGIAAGTGSGSQPAVAAFRNVQVTAP